MQVRKKIEFFAFLLAALFLSACETTRSDSNELVQLDTANSKDMEFQKQIKNLIYYWTEVALLPRVHTKM